MSRCVVISAIVIISVVSSGTVLALDGSGIQEDPWRIKSLEDFNEFAAEPNYWNWNNYTRLETDVNLAGMVYDRAVIAPDVNDSESWFQGTAFTGVFDGNDHKVLNLTIDDGGVGNDYVGLFGRIVEGEVRNLGLEGGSISGDDTVGGLVGANSYGSISHCYSTGSVSGTHDDVGGLTGYNSGSISNCYSTGYVSGDEDVGGLMGEHYGMAWNCYSTGNVNGVRCVGGLVGFKKGGLSDCYSTGSVSGDRIVGGLVGSNYLGSSVTDCYSNGGVSGTGYVGGLVGYNSGNVSNCCSTGYASGGGYVGGLVGQSSGSVSKCYSTGYVTGTGWHVGGLVGYNRFGSVSNSYSIGDVSGDLRVGGLVGSNDGSVGNCFWDTNTQTHGVTESIGLNEGTVTNVLGLPTSQLHQQSTFTAWNFINTWNIGENQTYPYLRTVSAGDINKDGITNFFDLNILCNLWMNEQ